MNDRDRFDALLQQMVQGDEFRGTQVGTPRS
jgi:hypothetical protein